MKTLILVVALAACVALSSARPHRGPGGPRRRHHPKPCRIVFNNGTEVNEECPNVGGFLVCEEVDLSRFDDMPRRPPKLENVDALSICLPKQCTTDADCNTIDAASVCTDRPVKPDRDVIEPLLDACFPDRPVRPESSEEDEDESDEDEFESDEDEDEEDARPLRCSLPPAMHIAKRACLVTYDGEDIGTPCRGPFGVEVTCNATVACTVNIAGKDADLHFCERPERPERPDFGGFRPFGGNRDEGNENTGNGRPFPPQRPFGGFRPPFGENGDEGSENTENGRPFGGFGGQFGRQRGNRNPFGGNGQNSGNGNFQRFRQRGN